MRAVLLAAAALALGACADAPMKYVPGPPVTAAPGALTASVAPVTDETHPTTPDDEKIFGRPMYNFAQGGVGQLPPKKLTDVLVADLAASGLFRAVAPAGPNPADVVFAAALKTARAISFGVSGDIWDFALQIDAKKGEKTVLSKLYRRRWKTGDAGMDAVSEAADLRDVMDEVRADLAKAL